MSIFIVKANIESIRNRNFDFVEVNPEELELLRLGLLEQQTLEIRLSKGTQKELYVIVDKFQALLKKLSNLSV